MNSREDDMDLLRAKLQFWEAFDRGIVAGILDYPAAEPRLHYVRQYIFSHIDRETLEQTEAFALSNWVSIIKRLTQGSLHSFLVERILCYRSMAGLWWLRSWSNQEDYLGEHADRLRLQRSDIPYLAEALWRGSWRSEANYGSEFESLGRAIKHIRFQHANDGCLDSRGRVDKQMAYAERILPRYDDGGEILAISPEDRFVLNHATPDDYILSIDGTWANIANRASLTAAGRAYLEQRATDDAVTYRDHPAGSRDFERKRSKLRRAIGTILIKTPIMSQLPSMASVTSYLERLECGLTLWQHRPFPSF